MVDVTNKKLKGLTFDELTQVLGEDHELREALIKHIAKNHARDFLGQVNLNARLLNEVSAKLISSNKEWQE